MPCNILCILAASAVLSVPCVAKTFWVKGSVHAHTNQSDGDASPQAVADWYRSHGYQFLVITDHNKLTDPATFIKPAEGFLLIPGEEVSAGFNGIPVHVNALGIDKQLAPIVGAGKLDTLRKNIDLVADAGGLALIDHPNWYYALGVRELSRAPRCNLLEIDNASSGCNNEGDAGHPSMETMWDDLLTHGIRMYGVADDDSHHYTRFGPTFDNPGRGWIVVRVGKLTRQEVLASIARGDFYASTGVELQDVRFRDNTLSVSVKPAEGKTYRIRFIGPGGKIADEKAGLAASCNTADAPNAYLRAKVIASDGAVAWTQPYWKEKL